MFKLTPPPVLFFIFISSILYGNSPNYTVGEAMPQQKEEPTHERKSILDRLQPIPVDSGFKQDGYFVWCGSMIRVGDQYHLFTSRWPKGTGDPDDLVGILDGYRDHSEIIRATADNPMGPFKFEEVVLPGRGGDYWDGKSTHGPKIVKIKDQFVLYYQAIAEGSELRKIGYAWSDSIEGPWTRCENEIPLTRDANNPGPYVREDGSVVLAFRTKGLVMHIAEADTFDGEYEVISENIFTGGKIEDPDLFFADGKYHMVMNDIHGAISGTVRNGGHLVSEDAIDWRPHEHPRAYSHDLVWTDGTSWTAKRRERPDFFNDQTGVKGDGEPTHLITGVLYKGDSWTVVQAIAPE